MATPPPMNKPPARPPGMPAMPKTPPPPKTPIREPRNFSVVEWSGAGEGEKVVIYGESGKGKTSIAAMAPSPVFIGVDDGARKIRDPRTGAVLKAISGIRDFNDVRDAINQHGLMDGYETLVIDTATKVEELSEPYIFDHYPLPRDAPRSLEGYGWGKGYRHSLEVMRLFFQDCEGLIHKGVNVVLLCQEASATMPNAEGLDYLQAGPKLHHSKQFSTRLEVQEWADHVLRIDYLDTRVSAASTSATKGKIISRDTTRGVYTQAARHYFAKNRDLTTEPIISFETAADDSLWRFMFPDKYTA